MIRMRISDPLFDKEIMDSLRKMNELTGVFFDFDEDIGKHSKKKKETVVKKETPMGKTVVADIANKPEFKETDEIYESILKKIDDISKRQSEIDKKNTDTIRELLDLINSGKQETKTPIKDFTDKEEFKFVMDDPHENDSKIVKDDCGYNPCEVKLEEHLKHEIPKPIFHHFVLVEEIPDEFTAVKWDGSDDVFREISEFFGNGSVSKTAKNELVFDTPLSSYCDYIAEVGDYILVDDKGIIMVENEESFHELYRLKTDE